MTTSEEYAQKWIDELTFAGMTVLQKTPIERETSATVGLYAVNGVDVEPSVAINAHAPDFLPTLDHQWERHVEASALYSENGEILVCSPVVCPDDVGWLLIQDPLRGESLASRLMEAKASPEFLALSTDGRHLCAISVEDDDYWIVTHNF
ncbi:hypothetical protein [Streptomyces sp. NPDC048644]|uniref:hypothetical protein n=1 Tax=Streptomyces sp. NPDC048644 TaxID=3365582 RepID=UPI00371FFA7A